MLLKLKNEALIESHRVDRRINEKFHQFNFSKVEHTDVPDSFAKDLLITNPHLFEEVSKEIQEEVSGIDILTEEELREMSKVNIDGLLSLAYELGIPKTVKNPETAIQKILEVR